MARHLEAGWADSYDARTHGKFPGVAGRPAVVILGPAQCKQGKSSLLIRGINKGLIASSRDLVTKVINYGSAVLSLKLGPSELPVLPKTEGGVLRLTA